MRIESIRLSCGLRWGGLGMNRNEVIWSEVKRWRSDVMSMWIQSGAPEDNYKFPPQIFDLLPFHLSSHPTFIHAPSPCFISLSSALHLHRQIVFPHTWPEIYGWISGPSPALLAYSIGWSRFCRGGCRMSIFAVARKIAPWLEFWWSC